MKEEIIKLLESIELNNEKGNEYFESHRQIQEDLKYAIKKIKESDEDIDLYEEIKEKVNKINTQESDFMKYRILNNISKKIIAIL